MIRSKPFRSAEATPRAPFVGCVLASLVACGPKAEQAPTKVDASPEKASVAAKAAEQASGPRTPREPFVKHPTAKPPPPPEGALLLEPEPGASDPQRGNYLYVQRCDAAHPCPKLLQTEGEVHCREFGLGVREHGWRLPSRGEAERFAALEGLERLAGYHWTRTPFEADMMQVWIIDPSGAGPSTTIPRERKPFTVRCVLEP